LWQWEPLGDRLSRTQIALLGGPLFFALWFIGAQLVWSAAGGEPTASRSEFAEVVLSNQSGAYAGGTLLVLAALSLLWFAAGLRERARRRHGIGLVAALGAGSVAMLLILQGGLVVEAASVVEEAPDLGWTIYQLSSAVGYESFMAPLLGAVTLIGTLVAIQRGTMRRWFWWLTAVIAAALTVGGTLEGLGVVPTGRFAIFFGLWTFTAGFALSTEPTTDETARPQPA
jgi:hypothetical protein